MKPEERSKIIRGLIQDILHTDNEEEAKKYWNEIKKRCKEYNTTINKNWEPQYFYLFCGELFQLLWREAKRK